MTIALFNAINVIGGSSDPPFTKTHDMTSGLSAPSSGYSSTIPIGSMVPATLNGASFLLLAHSTINLGVSVFLALNTPQNHWTEIKFLSANDANWDDRSLFQADASYLNAGFAQWNFGIETNQVFLNGGIYELDIT